MHMGNDERREDKSSMVMMISGVGVIISDLVIYDLDDRCVECDTRLISFSHE